MTEPSQYFKGRTVQEQMNEVIGYVDARAEEVAAAKADDVLQPAEDAKIAAQAAQAAAEDAQDAAEDARDATVAALPAVNDRIDDVESDLNAVTLRVTTAEGDIITIQGRITAVENKNTQQDSAIAGLVAADGQNVKIDAINNYAVGLTGNQLIEGTKLSGSFFLASNMNITNSSKAFAVASGYGIYRYGGAFFLVMIRDVLYFVRLHSGSAANIHSAEVSNPLTGEVIDKTTLTWSLGVVISNNIYYLVLKGIDGNKTATVSYLGGSQGGTVALTINPMVVVDADTLGTPEFFW